MSTEDKSRYAAAGFVVLLLLSLFWPAPVVSINRLWLHRDLPVDELSFLGREQPGWDVIFWCIAGLFAIALTQSGESFRRNASLSFSRVPRRFYAALAYAIAAVAATWLFADAAVVAFAERLQSDTVADCIRIANRLGGGMNPLLIVLFFLIAGVVYRRSAWTGYGLAMAVAGLSAGIVAQIVKFVVGRTRPELWLGAFHLIRGSANSFPSGHTVAAFALGGVLMFGSRDTAVRITALLLACFVAAARVLAFRHWPSDVVASALISLLAAWIASSAVTGVTGKTARDL